MRNEIQFPVCGSFVSSSGIMWNFTLFCDGSMPRMHRTEVRNGKLIEVRSDVTKECLRVVEERYGLKTDGSYWIE